MDKHLNKIELELQSLLNEKNFDELNQNQKDFVLKHSSKEDYILERNVILNASSIFENEETIVPAPLIIPKENSKSINTTIPLWQTISYVVTAACMVYFFFPRTNIINTTSKGETQYITQTDTVKTEVIKRDTVYQYKSIEKPIYIEKIVYVDQAVAVNCTPEEPKLLNVPQSNSVSLNLSDIETKGSPLENDITISLLDGISID